MFFFYDYILDFFLYLNGFRDRFGEFVDIIKYINIDVVQFRVLEYKVRFGRQICIEDFDWLY